MLAAPIEIHPWTIPVFAGCVKRAVAIQLDEHGAERLAMTATSFGNPSVVGPSLIRACLAQVELGAPGPVPKLRAQTLDEHYPHYHPQGALRRNRLNRRATPGPAGVPTRS